MRWVLGHRQYRVVRIPEWFTCPNGRRCAAHIDHGQGVIFVSTLATPERQHEAKMQAVRRAAREVQKMGDGQLIPVLHGDVSPEAWPPAAA